MAFAHIPKTILPLLNFLKKQDLGLMMKNGTHFKINNNRIKINLYVKN